MGLGCAEILRPQEREIYTRCLGLRLTHQWVLRLTNLPFPENRGLCSVAIIASWSLALCEETRILSAGI